MDYLVGKHWNLQISELSRKQTLEPPISELSRMQTLEPLNL